MQVEERKWAWLRVSCDFRGSSNGEKLRKVSLFRTHSLAFRC